MPDVYQQAAAFRRRLERQERTAAAQMVRNYRGAVQRIMDEWAGLEQRWRLAIRDGERISPSWAFRQERWTRLLAAIDGELSRFVAAAGEDLTAAQRAAVARALAEHRRLVDEQLAAAGPNGDAVRGSYAGPSVDAVVHGAGVAEAGPLRDLLERAAGGRPRRTARELRDALHVPLARALTIARTETLRAHREGQRAANVANPHLIGGWRWLAALDRRTCAVCWAMHGSEHPPGEVMGSHPNCRCTMLPITRSWAEVLPELPRERAAALPDTRPDPGHGPAIFARLPAAEQRRILGPGAARHYRAGELTLDELVAFRVHPLWGPTRSRRSLRALGLR
jgi:SPP1 gp7 family putative phage head morphogenesis protein